MQPEQPYVHQEERCPVADHVLGQLYRASSHGLDELVSTVPPKARAMLALYCYRRAHLQSIGLAIATSCEQQDLEALGGNAGKALFDKARKAPDEAPRSNHLERRKVTLSTGTPRKFVHDEVDKKAIPMIAIVDDDEGVREATKGLVRSIGYNASTFASAEDFLKSERIHDASCLITDLQMPGLSGIDLQDRLITQGHRIPIIFITAYPEESVRARATKAGAAGFLSKPYYPDHLIGCLDKALKAP